MEDINDDKIKKLEEIIETLSFDEINELYGLLINKYIVENTMDTENYVDIEYRDYRE